jgi:hypothetical protein
VFIAGTLSVDVATAVLKRPAPATASTAQNAELQHVVHVILDGMIGLGGMPPDIGECTTAANHFRKVLESGAFDIYPYAFSNYTYTRDSLPSILNGRLLKHHGEFPTSSSPGSVLHENLYFDELRRWGYRIRVYQSDWLRFASGNSDTVQTHEYKGSSLNPLHDLPLSWQARLGQLVAVYIDSDRHWSYWSTNRMPAIARRIPLGALTSKRMWPEQIVADYRSAAQKTLFFVHLMMPHTPYVYTAEGSITDPEGWSHETEFPSDQRSQYNDHYRRYCGQVYFTATQLQRFLDGLKSTRSYNSTTVIIHGDHGSRLRSVSPDDQRVVHQVRSMPGSSLPVVRYDYASEPDAASLVNRFSTLFATKKAGATMPRVVPEVGSVLHFLRQEFPFSRQLDTADALNSVYMFNPDGSPRPIRTMTKALSTRTRDEVPVEYQNKGEGNEREGQQ